MKLIKKRLVSIKDKKNGCKEVKTDRSSKSKSKAKKKLKTKVGASKKQTSAKFKNLTAA